MKNSQELIRSCCEDTSYIHDIEDFLPCDENIVDLTSIFKALSDPTRVKILIALLKYEICVGEMMNLLKLPQSHVSHQLKILRKYNIVTYTKDKKMSFYHIKNDYVKQLLEMALLNIKPNKSTK